MTAVTLECHTDYDIHSLHAFTANWRDETHRFHVWISIRPDIDGQRVPYPVKIDTTIYKNLISGRTADGRHAPTTKMLIDAKVNAKIKAEIKRLATYETLTGMFKARRAEIEAFDNMRAEADRLNAIFNAWRLLETATVDEKMTLGLI